MPAGERREQERIKKIRRLPADTLAEGEDFVDFLRQRQEERRLTQAARRAYFGRLTSWLCQPKPSAPERSRSLTQMAKFEEH
jgi:hypothetical protein